MQESVHETQLNALGRLLQALQEADSSSLLIERTHHYLKTEFDAPLIWIGFYDRNAHQFEGITGTLPTPDPLFLKQRLLLNPGDLIEQVVVNLKPIGVPDLQAEAHSPELRKAAHRFQIQGSAFLPIRYRDRCWGVVILGWQKWGITLKTEGLSRLSIALKTLAACLHRLEQLQQQTKPPDESFAHLLVKLRSLSDQDQQLDAIASAVHHFMGASRTSIYWFDPKQRTFELKVNCTAKNNRATSVQTPIAIPAYEMATVYQELLSDRWVAIDNSSPLLRTHTSLRLLLREKAKALLIAPVLHDLDLKGFLAVDTEQNRVWQEGEKLYLQGAANLVALTLPPNLTETIHQQAKTNQDFLANLREVLVKQAPWQTLLKDCALKLCKHLQADRFLLLLLDPDSGDFSVEYQNDGSNRRLLPRQLGKLSPDDLEMLGNTQVALQIENWPEDFRLLAWRPIFLEVGVKSLVLCQINIAQSLAGLILVGQETPRAWSQAELAVIREISQYLSLLQQQWRLQSENEQLQQLSQNLQFGLTALQQLQSLDELAKSAVQLIAKTLQSPLSMLVSWLPGQAVGQRSAFYSTDPKLSLSPHGRIPLDDPLIQQAVMQDELLILQTSQLTADTLAWFSVLGMGQVLAIALRTAPDHEPTGVLVIADYEERRWFQGHLVALGLLVRQVAWSRRHLLLTAQLQAQQEELERLNWHKLRKLEEFGQTISTNLKRLKDYENYFAKEGTGQAFNSLVHRRRYQEILQQLDNTAGAITTLIHQDSWQLQPQAETLLLPTLLKRSLEHIESLTQQRQLWSQLHSLPEGSPTALSNLCIQGEVSKIELVLSELLAAACLRSLPQGRIDLWPRLLDANWLELSITDSGIIDPQLLNELSVKHPTDLLAPSLLHHLPGLNLKICQFFISQVRGELCFYKLEDGRTLTRLVLPVITHQ
jgi:transcriptional regulator with GAF, ATPase, and Fis domain